MTADTSRMTHIGLSETSALIRRRLKAAFPRVIFSVRSKRYSGGSSITVTWDDGPVDAAVQAIVGQYQGGRFDASIDLAYHVTHWLLPNGTTEIATDPGSADQRGTARREANWMPHPDAKLVQFSVRHVFTTRRLSADLLRRCRDRLAERDVLFREVTITDGTFPVLSLHNAAAPCRPAWQEDIYAAARRTHCVTAAIERTPST